MLHVLAFTNYYELIHIDDFCEWLFSMTKNEHFVRVRWRFVWFFLVFEDYRLVKRTQRV